jgi:hypothetical protein
MEASRSATPRPSITSPSKPILHVTGQRHSAKERLRPRARPGTSAKR